jgi:hypothetical protein
MEEREESQDKVNAPSTENPLSTDCSPREINTDEGANKERILSQSDTNSYQPFSL